MLMLGFVFCPNAGVCFVPHLALPEPSSQGFARCVAERLVAQVAFDAVDLCKVRSSRLGPEQHVGLSLQAFRPLLVAYKVHTGRCPATVATFESIWEKL